MHPYTCIRSRRKSVALEITRDLTVVVRAPVHMPQAAIECFVAAHEQWITTHLQTQRQRQEAFPPLTQEQLTVLFTRARTELPPKVAAYSAQMGLTPTHITITAAQTRFGSCSAKNALSFSCRLMRYPEAAIDYVVVHELAHIAHHDHSPAFYALIERYLPDYRERQKLLRGT